MIPYAPLLLALCLPHANTPAGPQSDPPSTGAAAEWERIAASGGAECAFGDRYSFFYHAGEGATQLLIYFEGGGACWSWVSCSGMFDNSVDRDELRDFRGIFDFVNPANPFRHDAVLFIPYCSGDVHVGDTVQTYGEDVGGRPVAHRGAQNVAEALQWVKARFADPRRVVIAGASAGSYGAIFHAPRIAELYPTAEMVTIGDSGVPLLSGYEGILERWGAGAILRPLWHVGKETPMTLERAYRETAGLPHMRAVAQITSDRDAVQSAFYLISGSPAWREDSYALLDSLEHDIPRVRSFIVAGSDHGLMRTDAFYQYTADGTSLASWIGQLVSGSTVANVHCAECVIR